VTTSPPAVGESAPVRTFGPITRTDIVRYAGASGDFNPIHHDERFAAAAGFPGVFSAGMLQAGLLATFATDWLGARNIRRYVIRFAEQVWPGDELTCSGAISRVEPTPAGTEIDVELTCTRQTGAIAVSARATFLVVNR
jgi:acyl dehydratase